MGIGLFALYWYKCVLVVLACKSLHVSTVCIWRCEHARLYVEGCFYAPFINFHSFIPLISWLECRLSDPVSVAC